MSAVKEENQNVCSVCRKSENSEGDSVMQKWNEDDSESRNIKSKCLRWLEDSTSVCTSELNCTDDSSSTNFTSSNSMTDSNNLLNDVKNNISDAYTSNSIYYVRLKYCKNITLGDSHEIVNLPVNDELVNRSPILQQPICIKSKKLCIINRKDWLAQPPIAEEEFLEEPAKFVIISHTACYEGISQAENVLRIRYMQTFHIESEKLNDIAYNFLIGSDGNVYEGRGWGVVGEHTFGYNDIGIGISFVGCFSNKLPPSIALHQAKELINYGVEIGKINKNYILLGQCQCSPTESPGKKLFEEIQSWNHWSNLSEA